MSVILFSPYQFIQVWVLPNQIITQTHIQVGTCFQTVIFSSLKNGKLSLGHSSLYRYYPYVNNHIALPIPFSSSLILRSSFKFIIFPHVVHKNLLPVFLLSLPSSSFPEFSSPSSLSFLLLFRHGRKSREKEDKCSYDLEKGRGSTVSHAPHNILLIVIQILCWVYRHIPKIWELMCNPYIFKVISTHASPFFLNACTFFKKSEIHHNCTFNVLNRIVQFFL